jgi:serine/threonine protein kinase
MSTKSYSGSESEAENEEIDWAEFIINNKYIVLNKIGKGSYCTVWAAYNMELKKIFALKIYNEEDTEDAQNEIQVLNKIKKLNLSNVILYNDSFNYEYGDDTYIMQVIDLCGYSLNYIIAITTI